jgi:hypothetical protein
MSEKIKHLDYRRFDGFCAIANIANIFRDEDMLQYLDREEYIPSNHFMLTEIIQQEGYRDLFVVPMIQLWDTNFIEKETIAGLLTHSDIKIDSDAYFPFILNVMPRYSDTESHAVSVLRFSDHYLFSDPVKNEYIKIDDIHEIFNYFHTCTAIHALAKDIRQKGVEFVTLKLRHKFYAQA